MTIKHLHNISVVYVPVTLLLLHVQFSEFIKFTLICILKLNLPMCICMLHPDAAAIMEDSK